ncbi:MAG: UDP-N-acetylmuramoyl-L-alanyl-D-glutamate--2,6-diaminopimelate ligase [Flavobacteriales bacterium]|nr:UDP-N-acetylmuramoyl-L-alanyl-D-glutamate--2,6-diaminopimelate ligase [Flavobacteriales bacterium]
MKLLKDILYKAGIDEVVGSTNAAIEKICFDSRSVTKLSLFVAVPGTQVDGHDFIDQAVEDGAVAIVCETLPAQLNSKITYVVVADCSRALGFIASNFYENPSEEIKLVGITGTNGKTTTATLLYDLFTSLGYKVGLLSTVRNMIGNEEVPASHTTPDSLQLNALLMEVVGKGCTHCFMEVSSHAIDQNRIAGLSFDGAVFTNITHDHLDYHKTFDAYITAKKTFFDGLSDDAFALVNADDSRGSVMVQNCKAKKYTYALKTMADYKCRIIENQFDGLVLSIDNSEVWTKLIGSFNAYNLLTIYAVSTLLGEEKMDVLTSLSKLVSVEGRFEYFKTENSITGIVDYAHTPDALKNVLKTINDIRTGNEQVIAVVGCGGDRDADKRPKMAGIACELATKVVFTSDNPRSEDPSMIIEDMQKGVEPQYFKKTLSITDRKEAIKAASAMATEGDIILIAGKVHEKYQEIKGEKLPFDDMETLVYMLQIVTG